MTLTRKFILCLLYARNVDPKITPFHKDFNALAKEIVLEHYGLHLDELSDKKEFNQDVSKFASAARKYMGSRSMKTFITFKGKGNHQVWLSKPFPSPKVAKPAPPPPPPAPAPIAGKKRGRPSWDDKAPPCLKSDSVNKKVAKTIKDKYNVEHILDAAKLALKEAGYNDASKVLDFVQKDLDNNGEMALQALSVQGKYVEISVQTLFKHCSSTYGLVAISNCSSHFVFFVYLHFDVNTCLTSFFRSCLIGSDY